jgi:hypothetical protein
VVRSERVGPEAIVVSPDGRRAAFIGPSEFTVCVVDAKSLSEVCIVISIKPHYPKFNGTKKFFIYISRVKNTSDKLLVIVKCSICIHFDIACPIKMNIHTHYFF